MNQKPRQFGRSRQGGFAKRGQVSLPQSAPPEAPGPSGASGLGWIGGGIAAVALAGLVLGSGGSGGGLLAGLLGGLLGQKLASGMANAKGAAHAPAASHAPAGSTAPAQTVQRGGFGATAATTGGSAGHGAGA